MSQNSEKQRLIVAALTQIPSHGWTTRAFQAVEVTGAAPQGSYAAYFPGGMPEFVTGFHAWVNEGMAAALAGDATFATAKVREKIFRAVMARLTILAPHREAVRRLLGHHLLPWNTPKALRELASSADAMWHAAGDASHDYNWYTKRLLLAGVYAATLRYWVAQGEDGLEDYLRARIENVLAIGRKMHDVKEKLQRKAA